MSEGFRADSTLAQFISPLLSEDFYLVDVGCSGGIDVAFRSFGARLAGVGFDPNIHECKRLAAEEKQRIVYEPCFIDAPKRAEYMTRNPWGRLSVYRSQHIRAAQASLLSNNEKTQQNLWHQTALSERRININDYLADKNVDFFKIDIDGPDFLVMRSLDFGQILGVSAEVNFIGGVGSDEHTFHRTDEFMREQGFELYFLSQRRYSLAALPGRYLQAYPAQSETGRPVQGDALYFRDPVQSGIALSRDKTLKLAAVLALANQHDAAAELLIAGKKSLEIDLAAALDLLALEAHGRPYATHLALYEADDASFYPAPS